MKTEPNRKLNVAYSTGFNAAEHDCNYAFDNALNTTMCPYHSNSQDAIDWTEGYESYEAAKADGIVRSYIRALSEPLIGLKIETIRNDIEKLRGLINPDLFQFIINSYNAALNNSSTPGNATVFGDPESLEFQGD